jgi:hypothetical protein
MVCLSMRTAGRLQVSIVATTGLLLLVLVLEQVSGFASIPWFVHASAADSVKASSLQCSTSFTGVSKAADPASVLVDERLKKLQNVKNLRGENCLLHAVRSGARSRPHTLTQAGASFITSAAEAHITIGPLH